MLIDKDVPGSQQEAPNHMGRDGKLRSEAEYEPDKLLQGPTSMDQWD